MPLQLPFPSSRKITAEDLDYRLLRPLLVVPEIVSVDDYRDGVLVVKKEVILKDNFHDVAVAHRSRDCPVQGFYGIPFLRSPSPEDEDIFRQVLDQFAQTGLRRYFVRDPSEKSPFLVDIEVGKEISVRYSFYTEIRRADFSPDSRKHLDDLVNDLRQQETACRSLN